MPQPAIYVRQSVDHPEGIDRALGRARAMVAARGWPEAVEFTDNAVSASRTRGGDTGWGRMLAAAKTGEVDTIVGVDIDRLVRSIDDLSVLIGLGLKVVTVDGEIDLTTADGEFRATMLAGIARFETRRKGERQVRGNEGRVAKGLPVAGKRRFGFKPGNIEEEPAEAEQVRALFEGIAAGDSIKSWAERLDRKPVRVREVLTNPAYSGYVVRRGERFEAHESVARIVDRNLFETVQVLLSDPSRKTTPGNSPKHLCSGIARCAVEGCGRAMVKLGPNYICPPGRKGHPTIKVETLDDYVELGVQAGLMLWSGREGDPDAEQAARERIAALDENIRETAAELVTLTGAARAAVRVELVRMQAERDAAVNELSRALAAALPLTELLATGDDDVPLSFDLSGDFGAAWAGLGIDRQRELVRRLVESLTVAPGRGTERISLKPRRPKGLFSSEEIAAHRAARG